MSDPTGTYVISFNGEIYNYQSIRSFLEKKGYRFRSSSDTDLETGIPRGRRDMQSKVKTLDLLGNPD